MTAPNPDAVLHLAALHTLAATGFASTSRAASLTLSSTLGRYLRLVALACTERATLAGRSKVAAIDVLEALEELGIGGIGELQEWAVGLDQEVSLSAPGLTILGDEVKEGLEAEEEIVRLRMVPADQAGEASDVGMEDDEDEEVEPMVKEEGASPATSLRFPSPDFSWLPPLPSDDVQPIIPSTTAAPASHPEHAPMTAPTGSLSIIDRYRRRIPYSQSQLSETRPFVDPPIPANLQPPPPTESSFPALQAAYAATKNDPTIALRQTALRQQASDLLRRTIASPDQFSPPDTLVLPLPGPKVSPIIPSYSHNDAIPHRSIPIVSKPDGILSRLVHEMRSPHLPPPLRERLTSVRPPIAQMKDDQPILYGPEIRGPSEAALLRAKGKHAEAEKADQGLLQATWPTPAKGIERWGQKLVIGKNNVISSGIGEERPRVPEGRRPVQTPSINIPSQSPFDENMTQENGMVTPGGVSTNKIKFRLSAPSPSNSMPNENAPGGPSPRNHSNHNSPLPTPSSTSPHPPPPGQGGTDPSPNFTPQPIGLKLKLGVKRPESTSSGPNATQSAISPNPAPNDPNGQAPRPTLSLKLSSRSISPNKPPERSPSVEVKAERGDERARNGSAGYQGSNGNAYQ